MQLVLDEIHALQKEWEVDSSEWAGAGIINSSKVLAVTVSLYAELRPIYRRCHLYYELIAF